jgi:hypothetical protein
LQPQAWPQAQPSPHRQVAGESVFFAWQPQLHFGPGQLPHEQGFELVGM